MPIPTTTTGSAGRTPAAIGRTEGHPGPDGTPGQLDAAEGREPGPAGDEAPSPPLPIRIPQKTWPAGVRRLSNTGRGHVVRSLRGRAGAAEQRWIVVVLDADRDPQDAVPGFSSLDAADAYAEADPGIVRWASVPSRPAAPDRMPGT